MAEHTPGPWTVEEYGDRDTPNLVIHRGETENRVCFMATPGSHGDPAVIEADARLICAAPDMLALILDTRCPGGGWNGMSEEEAADPTVARCMKALSCGCIYGSVAAKATKA